MIERLLRPLLVVALLSASPVPVLSSAEIWVAPDGSDTHAGTAEAPMATLHLALRKARNLRRLKDPSVQDGVRIVLRAGEFRLTEPVIVRPEDSGTSDAPTQIVAADGERPVLSGGVDISGWRIVGGSPRLPTAALGHVWVADAPVFNGRRLEFRQLWVDGVKAVRAREPDDNGMLRLMAWDRRREEAVIPTESLPVLHDLYGAELVIHQQWEIANLRLRSWTSENEGRAARVTFHQPESRTQFEHPWPQPVMDEADPGRNGPFYLAGAIEFLDQPGEWAQDIVTGAVYYWPREGEDLSKARVVAPGLETLVEVAGTVDRPVEHVTFSGIGFSYTTWLRPSLMGHVPHQAGMVMLDAYGLRPRGTPDWRSLDNQAIIERPPAAVRVRGAGHVRIERCRFERLAMSGLDFLGGTHDDVIEGNLFRDVGGNGLQMGNYGDPGIEIHLPYDPTDERVLCARERIANNLVDDTANEDWGCVGISVGWAREITIEHNEVLSTSYTGISLGWGWTRTPNAARRHVVRANRIHRFATRMADCAGFYFLSAQPWTVISENAIDEPPVGPWVHNPEHWGFVYLDEGSSFTTVRDNWSPREKFIKNANGPGNLWENNGPMVGDAIKDAAGLEPAFRDLLDVVP